MRPLGARAAYCFVARVARGSRRSGATRGDRSGPWESPSTTQEEGSSTATDTRGGARCSPLSTLPVPIRYPLRQSARDTDISRNVTSDVPFIDRCRPITLCDPSNRTRRPAAYASCRRAPTRGLSCPRDTKSSSCFARNHRIRGLRILSVSRKSNHHQATYSAAVHVISISATTASKGSIVVYRCLAALAADPKGARRGHAQAFVAQAPAAAGSLAEGRLASGRSGAPGLAATPPK